MNRRAKAVAFALASVLVTSGCAGGGKPTPRPNASGLPIARGGTLRVGLLAWNGDFPHDPTTFSDFEAFTTWSCCLARTLYYYNGRPAAQGGGRVRPDLASGPAEISSDGLTWTFHIRPGLHYAPPLQTVEITAQDFIRALRRVLSPTTKEQQDAFGATQFGYGAGYFLSIQGAQEYVDGKADTISGLEALDSHTLRVHLTEANGDLPYRFSLVSTTPIPPNPFRPEAEFGVAEGHTTDGYGRFLVSSGPYMIEGSDELDFSEPPERQQPPPGLDPLVLVRNPSWQPSSDPLRPAYPDHIEFMAYDTKLHTITDFPEPETFRAYRLASAKKVDAGEIDIVADLSAPSEQVRRYQADPALRQRLQINQYHDVRFLSLNVALPPFDDIHVRRAVNFVIDKQRIFETWQEGDDFAAVYDHLAPDATQDNLLVNYHPYPSAGHAGDVSAAQRQMSLSPYDRNGDGRCDQPSCDLGVVLWRNDGAYPGLAPIVREDLAKIGITFREKMVPRFEMYQACDDPTRHATLCQAGWQADYPSATPFFPPLYSSEALAGGGANYSVMGATPDQLRTWGYHVASVPNVDERMRACETQTGISQIQCWVAFDQYLMEEVVPSVPILIDTAPWTFSSRVASFSFDQAFGFPALDQIALKPSA